MAAVQTDRAAEVAARRGLLHGVLVELEAAVSAAVAGDPGRWCAGLRRALDRLAFTLADHVEATEAPDGLLAEIDHVSPWLHARVERLRREHVQLVQDTATLVARCHQASAPEELREDVVRLLGELVRHRHAGADLLYDAYELDLSAGD